MSSRRFGQWQCLEVLGSGGSANVWKAVNDQGAHAAVKVLFKTDPRNPRYKRFRHEIQLVERLGDMRGILPILDYELPEEPGKIAWFAMPLAQSLRSALGELPQLEKVVAAIGGIATTLALLAREVGIAHRDIKPENLYWYREAPAVGDFGLADYPEKTAVTEPGRSLGPRWYIATEMVTGAYEAAGGPADVYSLAKSLWVLASGQMFPPQGEQRLTRRASTLAHYIEHPRAGLLDLLIERCTRDDPVARPSMEEFRGELQAWQENKVVSRDLGDLSGLASRLKILHAPREAEQDLKNRCIGYANEAGSLVQMQFRPFLTRLSEQGIGGSHIQDQGLTNYAGSGKRGSATKLHHRGEGIAVMVGDIRLIGSIEIEVYDNETSTIHAGYRLHYQAEPKWIETVDGIPSGSAREGQVLRNFADLVMERFHGALEALIKEEEKKDRG